MNRLYLLCVLAFTFGMYFPKSGFAQSRYADFEIIINQPSDSAIFEWGDTAKFSFYIRNNGPDTLTTNDTLLIGFLHFHQIFPLNGVQLLPGDTMQFNNAATLWNNIPTMNDTGRFCMSIHVEDSTKLIDSNRTNDTSCVVYILSRKYNLNVRQYNYENTALLNIFPNPASQEIYIQLNEPIAAKCNIRLLDMLGRIWKEEKNVPLGSNPYLMSISMLPKGIYILEVMTDKNTYRRKLVIR